MPRAKTSLENLLNKYVKSYNGIFRSDGEFLFCTICNKSVNYERTFLVKQHLNSQKHKDLYQQYENQAIFGCGAASSTDNDDNSLMDDLKAPKRLKRETIYFEDGNESGIDSSSAMKSEEIINEPIQKNDFIVQNVVSVTKNEVVAVGKHKTIGGRHDHAETKYEESLANFIKEGLKLIKNQELKDEFCERITSLVFEYKRRDRDNI